MPGLPEVIGPGKNQWLQGTGETPGPPIRKRVLIHADEY
jgi:hypothetical protein